ncbi:hypothetical protein P6144_09610 [Sphingomonas sp. HITSZ_GF]|uniref:hypothetical protein n=1 Tax=Sphingomonas sp. HITSZ_GF TaxID=3037247 RepID=UPI00240D77A9|nr:hypothetical protein [Sphingomonas sp. HITSZ_GF]MDG2533901.1 hypothetical protein [Sphingomonas sp. HITSZ_GF]
MKTFREMIALALVATTACAPAAAQNQRAQAPVASPALNDEFDGAALSSEWTFFHAAYGWPDKIKAIDVGKTTKGSLHIEPYDSAWVRDLQAPFLFKTVQGDFDMRARVRARGLNGDIPGGTWSLGGLMARVPNSLTADTWEPRRENWHFITTGVGFDRGKPMTETKGTYNSYSSLKLRPYHSGWMELRLVRVGMTLFALARPDENSPWELRDRFYRMENSPVMQAGLIAYTSSDDLKPAPENAAVTNREVNKAAAVDMALEVDWIRFAPAKPAPVPSWYAQVSGGNSLANPNIAEAAILAALGD